MAPNKYSYGYQMMQSRKKMVSREELETARVEASSSAKKPITVPTPRPRMAPGQGWGRPKRLFGGPREERLVRPSQEDIFADSQSPPEDHGTGLTETFNDPPLIGPSTSQASQDSPSSASLPLLPTPQESHLGTPQNQSLLIFSNETVLSDHEEEPVIENPIENLAALNVLNNTHENMTPESTHTQAEVVHTESPSVSPDTPPESIGTHIAEKDISGEPLENPTADHVAPNVLNNTHENLTTEYTHTQAEVVHPPLGLAPGTPNIRNMYLKLGVPSPNSRDTCT